LPEYPVPAEFFKGTVYGLTLDEIRTDPDHIHMWDEDQIDHDANVLLLCEDQAGLNGVQGVERSRLIAKAVLWIMEAYKDWNSAIEAATEAEDFNVANPMTPCLALETALIWDRG
jgi:hypothetical protein